MNTTLALVPRDGLFCKDGRGWHTSASGRGHALDWPWPSTVLGAIRSSWGRRQEGQSGPAFTAKDWLDRTREIKIGRTLILRRQPGASFDPKGRTWVVPADALWLQGHKEVYPLRPSKPSLPTLGRDENDEAAREALWVPSVDESAKPLSPPRWWGEAHFVHWLCGHAVPAKSDSNNFEVTRRIQAHVGIQPDTLTADEGVLFAHDVVETLERDAGGSTEWAIGAEAEFPGAAGTVGSVLSSPATLGADGRLAHIEELDRRLFDPPEDLLKAFRNSPSGIRLVLVTPAEFSERGWCPDGFEPQDEKFVGRLPGLDFDLMLRAAFVGRPVHISGWDMAQNAPKATSRMVPPGAVYFFVRKDGTAFSEREGRALWLSAIGNRTEQGFGRVAPGVWNAEEKPQ
jgi:CRISPR-associated protein Cmr3